MPEHNFDVNLISFYFLRWNFFNIVKKFVIENYNSGSKPFMRCMHNKKKLWWATLAHFVDFRVHAHAQSREGCKWINNNQSSSSVRPKTVALGGNKIFFTQKCITAGGGWKQILPIQDSTFPSAVNKRHFWPPLENVMKMIFRANHRFRRDHENFIIREMIQCRKSIFFIVPAAILILSLRVILTTLIQLGELLIEENRLDIRFHHRFWLCENY